MLSKYLTKKFYISSTIVFFIFFLDRISKSYVINLDKLNYSSELYKSKFLNINLIWNEGIAFGLLSFDQGNLYNLISLIISIIIVIVFFMIIKNNNIKRYPLLMIFGGAVGNLYDRITFKAVPDFIDFHIGEFHWFIFNVADIFISVGVIFMIFFELIGNSNTDHETV
ncbi:signal peptidase II [Candidatus Pelagibacter sp.]|nr:signal peptidase II [Candidatus Pelagibacter sp.]